MPPGFSLKKHEREADPRKVQGSADWGKDGLPGFLSIGLSTKQKSLAEIFQNDLGCSNPPSRHPSRPPSRNAFDENVETLGSVEVELALLRREGSNVQGSSASQNLTSPASYSYAAALGSSLSRSITPDPQDIAQTPSPCPTPIGEGRVGASKQSATGPNSFNGISSGMSDLSDLVVAFSGINLKTNGNLDNGIHLPSQIEQDGSDSQNYMFNMPVVTSMLSNIHHI
ncbi:hypothetical protein BVRB_2g046290 [Beta vulgaris subsp. vulgaris]|uniref:Nucleic acid binding NABP domain-containing protein n=1 Tax=Beta vulgaris subsp. vulgaris TaxID=3555 RepID=A0A0J8E818_BETVV|nr:hypothetical protein BVRB_2g046290 [Beta vulgaris subsp. vulgaris]